ncbi:hypothetical protein ACSRUE_18435 [Sorangium sp. KYC3313]|uniref:hypothetical protein n=1 Tax=Sorangium sp. KYC3313 TaxID=3449740 RepID=UPI003F89AAC7
MATWAAENIDLGWGWATSSRWCSVRPWFPRSPTLLKPRKRSSSHRGKLEGLREGELKAKRGTLLRLLARAGIVLAERESARIQACTDITTLDRWIDNVFGAKDATEVLS